MIENYLKLKDDFKKNQSEYTKKRSTIINRKEFERKHRDFFIHRWLIFLPVIAFIFCLYTVGTPFVESIKSLGLDPDKYLFNFTRIQEVIKSGDINAVFYLKLNFYIIINTYFIATYLAYKERIKNATLFLLGAITIFTLYFLFLQASSGLLIAVSLTVLLNVAISVIGLLYFITFNLINNMEIKKLNYSPLYLLSSRAKIKNELKEHLLDFENFEKNNEEINEKIQKIEGKIIHDEKSMEIILQTNDDRYSDIFSKFKKSCEEENLIKERNELFEKRFKESTIENY